MCSPWRRLAFLLPISLLFSAALLAQQQRITAQINNEERVVLAGHVPAGARPEFDQGPVAASLPMAAITMHLKPSAGQQSALEQLLAEQQDPSSPNYHQWLTPEQYADRFGFSQNDLNKIAEWLESQGFQVEDTARSRTWILFSGTAQQAENAFRTRIHRYLVNGETHFANATEPSIPAALAGIVRGFRGLHDFRLRPRSIRRPVPQMTSPGGNHQIVPDDFATLYDVTPLYTAGINGAGQKLVVVGQTDVDLSDISTFRSKYNLPALLPQKILVPKQANPGMSQNDIPEADLDLEWSGAVARNATIVYVYSGDVFTSVTDAIDQNYAPVISMSYGLCELEAGIVTMPMYQALAQQANAEGITWFAASGDTGAADCESPDASIAQTGLAVDSPASTPEITAMGGTEFLEQSGVYWSNTNTANGASALSYIPERVWNDSRLVGGLSAGGGGASVFFARPVWQTGPGVPNGGLRNLPDVSLSASPDHDGYLVYTGGSSQIFGGTSIGAPTMAGIATLLNQYLMSTGHQKQPGLGNINPTLYRLAQNVPGVFHDVVFGHNKVPCLIGSPDCTNGSEGFSAGPGYDQASGLGSPDAFNLVHQWASQAPTGSLVSPSIDQNPVFEQSPDANGNRWTFTLTLNEEAGIATTLTAFTVNGTSYDVVATFGSASIPANGSISSHNFGLASVSVPSTVAFAFSGRDVGGQPWSVRLSVPFQGFQTALTVGGASNAASGQQVYAPGMLLSVYGTALGDFVQVAGTVPLPNYLSGFEATVNGVAAPLYYVSPNQVNLQIPYETPTGDQTLVLGNPYVNANVNLHIAPAGPGIFMSNGFVSAPFSSAGRGKTTTLFITGDGQVNPSVATGSSPDPGTPAARLPKPKLPVTVKVANENATIQFSGIPSGLVGVTQINYVVPADAPLGDQPVVVTVGGVASQSAKLTVTQ
jgi:uncharacterized protein (TIGR03437 family)